MNRTAPIPFDPDALGHGQGQVMARPAATPSAPLLSDLLAAQPATEQAAPEDLKGTSKPLDNRAKWQLSDLAAKTYQHLSQAGQIPAGEKLEAFRQRVSLEACGRRISHATHGDRMLIQAAFLRLRGAVHQAARAVAKAATTPLDIARHKLWETVHQLNLTPAYAESICRRFYRCEVAELRSPKQVWTILYTVRNNANAAAGRGSASNRFKSRKAKSQ